MEDIGQEVIEEIRPTPIEEEEEEIEELTIEDYNLTTYSGLGMGAAGVVIMFGIGVGVIIRMLRRL